jgi:hypothetical protein
MTAHIVWSSSFRDRVVHRHRDIISGRTPHYSTLFGNFVYYESTKRELQIKPISECRCDERLKPKVEESTHLVYTGLIRELEHLKIKTRSIDEKFVSSMLYGNWIVYYKR